MTPAEMLAATAADIRAYPDATPAYLAVAEWFDRLVVDHGLSGSHPGWCTEVPCRELASAIAVHEAWWKSRGREPGSG